MKVSVIGTTIPLHMLNDKQNQKLLEALTNVKQGDATKVKELFDNFSGKVAGICYMRDDWDALINEPEAKSIARVNQTKNSGHHSVCDHETINLYLEGIPKALAIVLNNEKMYTTSEKSARYTKMEVSGKQKELFDKWSQIFEKLIYDKCKQQCPDFFTDSKIKKLAQENARYLISVFTPTCLAYSVSYRQLNYLYQFMQREINNPNTNKFYKLLTPAMKDFCTAVEKIGFIDPAFANDNKDRSLSLYSDYVPKEYFGDVYATTYKGSFAQLAQAQRHRTLQYTINLSDNNEFYVPPILKSDSKLVKEWEEDCKQVSKNMPQGMLINISEMGSLDNFILKMKERKCTYAQLEIDQQTTDTLKKYTKALKQQYHPLASQLQKYNNGSRCTFPDYKCTSPCGYKQGILDTREI